MRPDGTIHSGYHHRSRGGSTSLERGTLLIRLSPKEKQRKNRKEKRKSRTPIFLS